VSAVEDHREYLVYILEQLRATCFTLSTTCSISRRSSLQWNFAQKRSTLARSWASGATSCAASPRQRIPQVSTSSTPRLRSSPSTRRKLKQCSTTLVERAQFKPDVARRNCCYARSGGAISASMSTTPASGSAPEACLGGSSSFQQLRSGKLEEFAGTCVCAFHHEAYRRGPREERSASRSLTSGRGSVFLGRSNPGVSVWETSAPPRLSFSLFGVRSRSRWPSTMSPTRFVCSRQCFRQVWPRMICVGSPCTRPLPPPRHRRRVWSFWIWSSSGHGGR